MTSPDALRKLIFAGCRTLGLDAELRHDLQLAATGKASLSDMNERELRLVVGALKECGFEPQPGRKAARKPAGRADIRFCHVMWRLLYEAGAVKVAGPKGLNAFVRSQFEGKWKSVPIDIDALTDWHQINDVVEALKAWCAREGIALRR